jgi:hypothetical protein
MTPIQASLRNEPSHGKPSQASISKSKHVDDSHDRQAAEDFVDNLFASILDEA